MQEKNKKTQELAERLKLYNSMLLDATDTKATEKNIINAIRVSLKKENVTFFNLAKFAVELDLYAIIELLQNKIGAKQELAYYAGIFDKPHLVEATLFQHVIYLNKAVMGASAAGNIVLIEELLAKGAHIKWAIKGAANKNQVTTLNELIKKVGNRRKEIQDILEEGARKTGNPELASLLPGGSRPAPPCKHRKLSQPNEDETIDQLESELVTVLTDLKSNKSSSPLPPSL